MIVCLPIQETIDESTVSIYGDYLSFELSSCLKRWILSDIYDSTGRSGHFKSTYLHVSVIDPLEFFVGYHFFQRVAQKVSLDYT